MNPRAAALAGLCAAIGAAGAVAQDGERFDAAWSALVAAPRAEWQPAARRASDAFLALPPGPDRAMRLANGIEATLLADRVELALALADEARTAGSASEQIVALQLRALARLGRLDALVTTARAAPATQRAAVDAALLAEQAILLPLADAALRRGYTGTGRFVFQRLAMIEPLDAWRLANYALACRHVGDLEAAGAAYRRAAELAPNDPLLVSDHGLFLRATGQLEPALALFQRSLDLDTATPGGQRGAGPAITNLLHVEALQPGRVRPDPLPEAADALAVRPGAVMLRRLVLDSTLDRLQAADHTARTPPPRQP